MTSRDASDEPQRVAPLRELLSLALMILPLAAVLLFFLINPEVWTSKLAVFFSQERELARSDLGWILSALALGAAALCAWIGLLGTRERWKHNRRWQRGVLGSLAATLLAVLMSGWVMTQVIREGRDPDVSLAMFLTMCALLYGLVCAAVSPRDSVGTWDAVDPARDEANAARTSS